VTTTTTTRTMSTTKIDKYNIQKRREESNFYGTWDLGESIITIVKNVRNNISPD
jgi:hypothetical protein